MTIRNVKEAEAVLLPYVPLVAELSGKDTTLERIEPLMKLLGHPEQSLRVVHLAGTSGKTSTAYYMAALLTAAGQKTGLTVSPHVDSITERVQINGKPLSEKVFCKKLAEFLELIEAAEQRPSYFELLYAFALWVMSEEKVDYAVVETGVGGLHDATNVAKRPDKVCIITDIGFDHMKLLGDTLPEIAAQKIGIVHSGNQVFCYRQNEEIMHVFEAWVNRHHASMHVTEEVEERKLGSTAEDTPNYQQRNWLLAYFTYRYLSDRDGLPSLTRQALSKTQQVQVPGRMDVRQISDKTIIMDGAHNAAKMTAFVDSFQRLYPGAKPTVLIALKEGKDYEAVVPIIGPMAGKIIVTTFNTTQDLPARSLDPNHLKVAFEQAGFKAEAIADQNDAVKELLQSAEPIGVVTGSFYLLSQIRNNTELL